MRSRELVSNLRKDGGITNHVLSHRYGNGLARPICGGVLRNEQSDAGGGVMLLNCLTCIRILEQQGSY